jgi:integrase
MPNEVLQMKPHVMSLEPDGLTMADVISRLENDTSLKPSRRRDLASAVRRTCELFNRIPEQLQADVGVLRYAFASINAARAGVSDKTMANLRSNALAALRHVRDDLGVSSKKTALSEAWKRLQERLPDRRFKNGLSRFMRFCSTNGIAPSSVSDVVVDTFMDAVRSETLHRKPNDLHRRTTRLWNEAVKTVPGWPQIVLTVPSFRPARKSIPITEFPASFQKDIDEHGDWLGGKDLFCANPPPKICKPSTVDLRKKHIQLAASALVQSGQPIEGLQSLADLVTPAAVKAVLRHYLDRYNDEPTQFLRDLTKTLKRIAQHWVRVDADHLEALKDLGCRLGPDRSGLTEKNKATLRQFDSDHNTAILLDLPFRLFETAMSPALNNQRAAVRAQIGIALAILTVAPLRMHNLIALRLDQHIVYPGGPRGPVHIVIPANEAKAGEPIEYLLPTYVKELLDIYLREFRIHLGDDSCPWLFLATGGNRKAQATLSQQIKETITKETGLMVTPHQFRHIAAKFVLDHNPGNFETVRQLLMHKNGKSTSAFYIGLQSLNAGKHYDKLLSEKRKELAQQSPPKSKRRRR